MHQESLNSTHTGFLLHLIHCVTQQQQEHNASVMVLGCYFEMQVAAAARERAEIAEQRLAQRTDLAQERLQHATDLAQVNCTLLGIILSSLTDPSC